MDGDKSTYTPDRANDLRRVIRPIVHPPTTQNTIQLSAEGFASAYSMVNRITDWRGLDKSEILWAKPGILPNPGEGRRADLFAIVKGEGEVGTAGTLQFSVGADLLLERPSDPHQGCIDSFGFGGTPRAHAANRTFSGAGTSSPLSCPPIPGGQSTSPYVPPLPRKSRKPLHYPWKIRHRSQYSTVCFKFKFHPDWLNLNHG